MSLFWEEDGGVYGGINADGQTPDWGGEHTVQCMDDMLWNCAPEICVILLTSVTPINSIKGGKVATKI